MLFTQDREKLRSYFRECWEAHVAGAIQTPLETLVAEVVAEHPEYHAAVLDERSLEREWHPEDGATNPFLHMGLHIALREQLSIDRPAGIRAIARQLLTKFKDGHAAEHAALDCLAESLWLAQRNQSEPDEIAYLECLRTLAQK
jgi:hypothetical protein